MVKSIEGTEQLPHNYGFNKNLIRNGLVNKAMIVGKNGCGKTSFGFALFDIVYTLTLDFRTSGMTCRGSIPFVNFQDDPRIR